MYGSFDSQFSLLDNYLAVEDELTVITTAGGQLCFWQCPRSFSFPTGCCFGNDDYIVFFFIKSIHYDDMDRTTSRGKVVLLSRTLNRRERVLGVYSCQGNFDTNYFLDNVFLSFYLQFSKCCCYWRAQIVL